MKSLYFYMLAQTYSSITKGGACVSEIAKVIDGCSHQVPAIAPIMIDIPQGKGILIGTPTNKIETLLTDFGDIGLEPEWLAKQTPMNKVNIPGFRIAKHPVTNLEWALFEIDSAKNKADAVRVVALLDLYTLAHPKFDVTFKTASKYTSWLSKKLSRQFRLPTEMEWEYVATGGDGRLFPWGNVWNPAFANTKESGIRGTVPVNYCLSNKSLSVFGCAQMAGNVEEITSSKYCLYEGSNADKDAFAKLAPNHRITKGGSFAKRRDLAMCQRRHGAWVDSAIGVRLAEEIHGK